MSLRAVYVLVGQTLRSRRTTLLGWALALALLVVIYVAMFPSIKQIDLEALMKNYPKELLRAFGVESGAMQLSTAIGFINTELFGFMLPLAIVFLPAGIVTRMTARAEDRGYLEVLLSAPLARWQLAVSAAISATVAMVLPIVLMVLVALGSAAVFGVHLTLGEIGRSALSLLPIGALAGSIALLVVGMTRRHGAATAVAAGVTVVMYLMNVLAGFITFFEQIRVISLFHHYSDWINDGIAWSSFIAWLALAAVLTALGAILYERRDLA